MAIDYAQLKTTNPAEYQRLIQQKGQQLAAGLATNAPKPPTMGAPQSSPVPAPMNTPTNMSGFTMPGMPSTSGVPAPKDMSGFKSTMPGLPQAPSSPVPAPQMGYGGGNYNDLGWDDKAKMQNDASRIQSDPTFRQSEIDRTLGVIKNRQGQDVSQQNDYLTRVLGYQAPQAHKPPQQVMSAVPAPVDNRAYSVGTDADRDAEARRRVEQAIADKRRIATQQKTGLATTFGRMRQEVGEDRALQNVQNDRSLSAFNGRSDYARAMIAREREKTDRQQQEDFATRNANVDEMLAGYENASAEERQRIVDELVRQDRDFGLSQGSLTGTYGNQRTLAGSAQDFNQGMANKQFDRGVLESDRGYNYQTGRDAVLDNRYDKQLDRSNFESDRSYDLAKSSQEWGQLMQKETFDFNKAQTIWDNNFKDKSFQQSMNEAAASRGLQWANINQRDKEFIADQAFKEKSWNADQTYKQYAAKERDFDRGLELYKTTGQMPPFMADFGIDVQGLSSPQYADDLSAMYGILSSGQAKPQDMLKQIDDKVKIGAERPEDGQRMKQAIYKLYPNLDPANKKPSSGENPMLSTSGENGFVNDDWLKRAAALGIWGMTKLSGN